MPLELADRALQVLEVRGEILKDGLEDIRREIGDQAARNSTSPGVPQEPDGRRKLAQAPLDVIEPRRALGTRPPGVEGADVRHVPS